MNAEVPTKRLVAAAVLVLSAAAAAQEARAPRADRRTPVVRVFEAAKDAVVNISSTRVVKTRSGFFGGGPGFGFGGDPFDDVFLSPFTRNVPVQSLGSGFVIHPAGYIVTNEHVVRRAMKITVFFADQTSLAAGVIASDPTHDLAVLKVAPPADRALSALVLGRSDDLMIGETVVAIGNPKGYRHSLTAGVISALDRELAFDGSVQYKGLIQTDASINPGNSGGPLLNVNAEVIGVNTAIRPDAQGIGFAIAVDDLKRDLPNLLDFRRINRVIIGMDVEPRRDFSAAAAAAAGGLVVSRVQADGPAAAAGVEVGQTVASIDGRPAASVADYYVCLLAKEPGDTVTLEMGDPEAARQAVIRLIGRPKPDGNALARKWLGLAVRPITSDLARQMRLPTDRGLLVTAVVHGGPADAIGVRVGDVLFQLAQSYLDSPEDLGRVLEDVDGGQVMRIGIHRGLMRAWTGIRTAQE